MSNILKVATGQHSDKGRKDANQDFHGICIPEEPQLSAKGIAIALADGISSSDVSQIASQSAVTGFLEDYYCTSDAWSVKTSAERVLSATNAWLYSQTMQSQGRYDKDRGYVCTMSAVVVKSTTAHIFHVGDARVYRLRDKALEQLTSDHRIRVSGQQSYLGRALGINPRIEIDYQALQLETGDTFVLATDGVYEYVDDDTVIAAIHTHAINLDKAAGQIAAQASQRGSPDNLTVQIVRIDALPDGQSNEIRQQLSELALPPMLDAGMEFDGYRIVKCLHDSSRSHLYLATDTESGNIVVLKTPSVDLRSDPAYLERFMMEEWVARRIHSAHVLKPYLQSRPRRYLYVASEFIEGQSLKQWMIDHPNPDMESVRRIVEQIARGLRAFHRLEMLHQDLRPDNIMIDRTGTVKIIDFGATSVAGVTEASASAAEGLILGTHQYAAPEYFLGEGGTVRSDIFSLGVIAYQMLTGRLPYGADVAKATTRAAQRKLRYRSVLDDKRAIPAWIDGVLAKAVHPEPHKRYQELSEFVHELRHPSQAFLDRTRRPLIERHPLRFWKGLSFILAAIVLVLLAVLNKS